MKRRKEIGLSLRLLRESMNYTQSFVAGRLGVATNTYSLMEKGLAQLTLDRIEILSKLYNVSPSDMISMEAAIANGSLSTVSEHEGQQERTSPASNEQVIAYLDQIEEHMAALKELMRRLRSELNMRNRK